MDPRSEVLLRQAELFGGELLLAGLPADDLLGALPQARGWNWHAGDQALLAARFAGRCQFATDMPEGDFRAAVLFLPKSRELADYLLQALASRLGGKPLYLVGEKRGGIERAAKQLAAYGKPRKLDSARHCQLWCVEVEQAPSVPDLHALAQSYSLPLADGALEIVTLPGVFAHGRLDRGSALLLEHLDDLPSGHLLDFGCGSGILAIAGLLLGARQAVGTDIDPQALEASRDNAERNGIAPERFTLYLPEQLPQEPADVVVANILAGPLVSLAPQITALVKPGGRLALSGILAEQADEVRAAYSGAFDLDPTADKDGWVRISGVRRS